MDPILQFPNPLQQTMARSRAKRIKLLSDISAQKNEIRHELNQIAAAAAAANAAIQPPPNANAPQ